MSKRVSVLRRKWTPEAIKTVNAFARWMEDRGLSQHEAARHLDISHSTVSPMLAHKYPGDVAGICERMARVLRRSRLRAIAGARPDYVTTAVTEEVVSACTIAHTETIIALVLGPSGIGKTCGLRRYCEQEPEAIYVHAGVGASPWSSLRLIAQALGVAYHVTARQLRSDLAAGLQGSGRLLILDELDYVREPTLQALRMLQEEAGVGMVWSSTGALWERLRGTGSRTLRQVVRRIRYVAQLTLCGADDIRRVLASYKLEEDTVAAVVADAAGEVDRAISVVVRAHSQRNGEPRITPAAIARAYRTLPPAETATQK